MKIIQTVIVYNEKGVPMVSLKENIPLDTIYAESKDGQYICYQPGDELPENACTLQNMFSIQG